MSPTSTGLSTFSVTSYCVLLVTSISHLHWGYIRSFLISLKYMPSPFPSAAAPLSVNNLASHCTVKLGKGTLLVFKPINPLFPHFLAFPSVFLSFLTRDPSMVSPPFSFHDFCLDTAPLALTVLLFPLQKPTSLDSASPGLSSLLPFVSKLFERDNHSLPVLSSSTHCSAHYNMILDPGTL